MESVDPKSGLAAFEPFRSVVERSVSTRLVVLNTIGSISPFAFDLTDLGVFRVAAESMPRRPRDVGIRRALGAPVERVRRDLGLHGMYPVFIGLGVGIACANCVSLLLQGVFFGVGATDPATYLAARRCPEALRSPARRWRQASGRRKDRLAAIFWLKP